jgi:hypothetical protein
MVGEKCSGSSKEPPATLANPVSRSAQSLLPQLPQKFRVFVRPDFAVTL